MAPPDDDLDEDELSRWQLPLRPLDRPLTGAGVARPAESVLPPITLNRHASAAPEPAESRSPEIADDPGAPPRTLEPPDITARFVVAKLAELNERLAELTEATAERTTEAITNVHEELARLGSLREHDLTEQAAGIFAAVAAGTESLDRFANVVAEVTNDLRLILTDTLSTIGGADGLAEAVVQGASDLAETRSELVAGIGRIQRDLATLRKRIPLQTKSPAKLAPAAQVSDEQVAYIVEAVTEAVVAALLNPGRPTRRKAGA